MELTGNLKNEPCTIGITVRTKHPKKFYLTVKDKLQPNTVYSSRYATIDKQETFYVRMPLAPEAVDIKLISQAELTGYVKDNDYRINVFKQPLLKKLNAFDYTNPVINSFVQFAEQFAQKAGYISAGNSIYTSDDGKFRIDYVDDIKDREGRVLSTPARISRSTAIIDVSRNKFLTYTVPQRMAILLHEFAHYYLNEDMSNEIEADLNALLIYLGLGYPRIDALNVFTQVFATAPSELNVDRLQKINNFIHDFEKRFVSMSYDKNHLLRMERMSKKRQQQAGA